MIPRLYKLINDGIEISDNEQQLLKANSPIDVTDVGMKTCARDMHPSNAFDPIDVTFAGINIWQITEQFSNAFELIDKTVDGILNCESDEHPLNVDDSILSIPEISILSSDEHSSNAPEPIDDNGEVIVICLIYEQFSNALDSIDFTEVGIIIFESETHPLKQDAGMDSNFAKISILLNEVHSSNTFSPKLVTDEGIEISKSDTYLQNELAPMNVTDDGIVTLAKDKHPLKTLLPIDVTVVGIIICVNEEHPENELSSKDLIYEGKLTSRS